MNYNKSEIQNKCLMGKYIDKIVTSAVNDKEIWNLNYRNQSRLKTTHEFLLGLTLCGSHYVWGSTGGTINSEAKVIKDTKQKQKDGNFGSEIGDIIA